MRMRAWSELLAELEEDGSYVAQHFKQYLPKVLVEIGVPAGSDGADDAAKAHLKNRFARVADWW